MRAFREDSTTGEREATTESHSEYVTIDGGGEPMLVPELTVESDRGQCLRQRALDDGADGDA